MSKKKIIIQGNRTQKILLLIDVVIIIGLLFCMFLSKPLGISETTVTNIAKYGLLVSVIIGLVVSMISGEEKDDTEKKKK